MKFEYINYLLEVAKQGSLNKAAKALFISQPNLSTIIKEFEDEFGIQIFNRSNRGITLTDNGRELINSLTIIANQLDYLLEEYRNSDAPLNCQLNLIHNELCSLMDCFCQFKQEMQMPDLTCNMTSAYLNTVVENIASNANSGLGIICMPYTDYSYYQKIFVNKNLTFTELFKVHGCLIVGKNHPWYEREFVSLEEVSDCTLAYYSVSDLVNYCKFMNFHINSRPFIVNSKAELLSLITHSEICGVGIDFMESPFFTQSPDLRYIPVKNQTSEVIFGTLHNENFHMNNLYLKFVAFLKSNYEKNYDTKYLQS